MYRVKYSSIAPLFFILLISFLGILVFFYQQSVNSVQSVLSEQLTNASEELGRKLGLRYAQIERETKYLSRNEHLKSVFSENVAEFVAQRDRLHAFIDHFKSNAEVDYSTIIYTDNNGNVVFNAEEDYRSNTADGRNPLGSAPQRYLEVIFTAFQPSEIPQDKEVDIRVLQGELPEDATVVLRRKTNMRGDNGILYAVLPWKNFLDMESDALSGFVITDKSNSQLLYASQRGINSAISLTQPTETPSDFLFEERRYLYINKDTDSPWIITNFVELDTFLEKPQRIGRITLAASVLFIAISAFIIGFLIRKIRQHTEDLEAANNSIILQNKELQEARIVVEEHNKRLEEELETASQMQMRLMPTDNPSITGFNIAGRCRPATHVGGDFFQYYPKEQGRFSVAMADVTGHGMQAAIPNVLFSGMLENQMELEVAPEAIVENLNRSLTRSLEPRTFVCFSLGELDPELSRIRLVNGGCPYPYHYVAATSEVHEVENSALPLGLRAGSEYAGVDCELAIGDRIVFCSDGIIEAGNVDGQLFGFDRTRLAVERLAKQGLTAESMVDTLLAEVDAFCDGTEQDDDQTIVVIEVTS